MPIVTAFGRERGVLFLRAHALLLSGCLAALPACGDDDSGDGDDAGLRCMRDDSEDRATALTPAAGEAVEGYLCPDNDEDWYAADLSSGDRILHVKLEMLTERTPVDATYLVFDEENGVAMPAAGTAGEAVDDFHCLDPGQYYVVVEDSTHDAQDIRSPYEVSLDVLPEPDANEPNDASQETAATSGDELTGYIACRGDQDHFAFDVAEGQVVNLVLRSEIAAYTPKVTMFDPEGTLIATDSNPRAQLEPTALTVARVVEVPGRYTVVVTDDDDLEADPEVPYTLTITTLEDADDNEPNDVPVDATALSAAAVGCSTDSAWFEATGTIGAVADVDWFALPTTGCSRGVVEAELLIASPGSGEAAWMLQDEVQAAVSLVRTHATSPCGANEDCAALTVPCDIEGRGAECAGLGGECNADGLCAGAITCMPTGACGANEVTRFYTALPIPTPISGSPPPNEAKFSAPILDSGTLYFRVSDFQSNGGNPAALYTFRARIRRETDTHEINNLYTGNLVLDYPFGDNESVMTAIPVHSCTTGDCCTSGTWVEGYLTYDTDIDYYTLPHPCPGADCLLNIKVAVNEGPTQPLIQLFHGGGQRFGAEMPVPPMGVSSGVFGRDADQCVLGAMALEGNYTIVVRDNPMGGIQASSEQFYRFCVEKVTTTCVDPCVDDEERGCGDPDS